MRPLFLLIVLSLAAVATASPSFSFTGHMSIGAAACLAPAECASASLPQSRVFDLGEYDGDQHLVATLAWVRSTPLAEKLRLGVSFDTADGQRVDHFVEGRSPLTLDRTMPVQGRVLVWASFPPAIEPVPATVSAQQAFHVGGSLTQP